MRETSPHGYDNYIPGNYWGICDICGLKYRIKEMKERFDNSWACEKCFDPRHPQEDVRVKADDMGVPVALPEGEDVYITVPITQDDL